MTIAFTTSLSDDDWDDRMSGWRCSALKIPGSAIEAIYVAGRRQDMGLIEVVPEHHLVRWPSRGRPSSVVLSIRLTKELEPRELSARWKKLAIVLPILASLLVAFGQPLLKQYDGSGATETAGSGSLLRPAEEISRGPRGWPEDMTIEALKRKVAALSANQYRILLAVEQNEGADFNELASRLNWNDGLSEFNLRLSRLADEGLVEHREVFAIFLSEALKKRLAENGFKGLRDIRTEPEILESTGESVEQGAQADG